MVLTLVLTLAPGPGSGGEGAKQGRDSVPPNFFVRRNPWTRFDGEVRPSVREVRPFVRKSNILLFKVLHYFLLEQ